VTNKVCWNEHPWIEYLSSNRSFCAGNPHISSPCNGDSGMLA